MGFSVFPAAGGGVTPKVSTFTSTGTFTAPSNCSMVEVFLVGGGGGGGAANASSATSVGGGGGGGQVIQWRKLAVTPGTSYTVTIGSGGAGSTSDAAGAVGGDTSFGSLATAFGGGGGGTRGQSVNTQASIKATSGGQFSVAGYSGSGGGAAAMITPTAYSQAFGMILTGNQPGSITGQLNGGFSATASSDYWNYPGLGIDGYGGGGWFGSTSFGPGDYGFRTSVHGGGTGAYENLAGGNAVVNRGGGGGGAAKTGTNAVRAGGNGGSGYAIIVYYS